MPSLEMNISGDNNNNPPKEGNIMNPDDYGILKMHALNGAQRQADSAGAYSNNLQYDYLEGKANLSMTEGLGIRYVQGPHPQHGSPDSKV